MTYHQNLEFELVSSGEDYQLVNTNTQLGIFVNRTAALIWSMGAVGVEKKEIIDTLVEQFPSNAAEIIKDVDGTITMLTYHGLFKQSN